MSIKKLKMREASHKKINGIVYTPKWIVELILDKLDYKENIEEKKIIDPACGDGAFLSIVVKRFIESCLKNEKQLEEIKRLLEKNIYGIDIEKIAVDNCKIKLKEVTKEYGIFDIEWNILEDDSLEKRRFSNMFNTFDFVVGNPPYIRIQHLGKERRSKIQNDWSLCKYGSTDIFIAFFELGYYLLNDKGKLGYITPNTFLKTKAGKSLRNFLRNSLSLKVLIDFEHNQVFENATTYSLITILDKGHKKSTFSLYKGDLGVIKYIDEVDINNLDMDNWILASNDILKKIGNIEDRGISLDKIAKIHVGITTLADDYYIFQNLVFEGNKAKIKLKDGRVFNIEKSILKPIVKVSVLKDEQEEQNRFIIFPYKKISGKHTIIPEDELKKEYPLTYAYFLAIKDILLSRDKGKPNPVSWYAFGRSQGLDTSFGKKILTSPINLKPKFIVWEKEDYTFYAGYCIKYDGDLNWLANNLNSAEMEFYINSISRNYQNNYKSFAKSFIRNFSIEVEKSILSTKKDKIQQLFQIETSSSPKKTAGES